MLYKPDDVTVSSLFVMKQEYSTIYYLATRPQSTYLSQVALRHPTTSHILRTPTIK